ncbi:MAG: hypothetical protein V1746_02200, partial [bacterium]
EFNAGSLGFQTTGSITGANKFIATGALTANGDLTNIFDINVASIHSTSGDILGGDQITTTGNIQVDAGSLGARTIDAGSGSIAAFDGLVSENVLAGGPIAVGSSFVKTLSCSSGLTVGAGGIQPHTLSIPATVHDYTVDSIRSDGGVQGFRGDDATTLVGAKNGNTLHLNVANGVSFSSTAGADTIVGPVNLSGGDGSVIRPQAGDGGSLYVAADGLIDVKNTDIRACAGAPQFSGFEGKGGSIELVSNVGVSVGSTGASKISVGESAITTPPPYPATSSDGGLIRLKSLASSGAGIKVQNSSQLLAIVSSSAPSISRIELLTSGSDIQVDAMCKIDASSIGKIVMDTTATMGNIALGSGGNLVFLNADIVRARAGQNMVLRDVTMSAPTSISLYAGNLLDFQSGVSLFSPNIILSSPTISFVSPVTVSSSGVTINAYTSTPVSGANFTGGSPTINNYPAGTAPTFVP